MLARHIFAFAITDLHRSFTNAPMYLQYKVDGDIGCMFFSPLNLFFAKRMDTTNRNRDLKYDYMILLYPGPTEDFPRKFIRLEEPRR